MKSNLQLGRFRLFPLGASALFIPVLLCWVIAGRPHAFALSDAGDSGTSRWDAEFKGDMDEEGDRSRVPIVFVHSAAGSGELFARQAMHFTSNGYPRSWITVYDYDAADGRRPRELPPEQSLQEFIDQLCKRTGHRKIHLVSHELGIKRCAAFLKDPENAAKVARHVHFGGAQVPNFAGVLTMGIGAKGVPANVSGEGNPRSNKVNLPDWQDYFTICTSDEGFVALYSFLNWGELPKHTTIVPERVPLVGGYVKYHSHNVPIAGASVDVWEVAPGSGERLSSKPLISFKSESNGRWGPMRSPPNQPLEFVVYDPGSKKTLNVFHAPFQHSDLLVYFNISAKAPGYHAGPFDAKPALLAEKSGAFYVRHQNGSFRSSKMSLKVNGLEVLVPEMFSESVDGKNQPANIAISLADANQNEKSDRIHSRTIADRFVVGFDLFVAADPKSSVEFKLNNHVINVPAGSGQSRGQVHVVFHDCD